MFSRPERGGFTKSTRYKKGCSFPGQCPLLTNKLSGQVDSKHRSESVDHLEDGFPPPPHLLVDARGRQRFLVQLLLNHRDGKGHQTNNFLRWQGYPPSADRLDPCSQLTVDVLDFVGQYDKEHLIPKRARQKTSSRCACTGTANLQSPSSSR